MNTAALKSNVAAFAKKHRVLSILIAAAALILVLLLIFHPHGKKTYLIIGMDNYGSLNETGRSDVMMMVQLDFDRAKIHAVTFARDMFLTRPDGKQAKVNTIIRSEDENALVETLENTFDLHIDGWFRLNFTTVIELVDALGGAQVDLTSKEVNYINKHAGLYPDYPLQEGPSLMNGGQALAYARCRALDSDIGRGDRQTKLVSAMVKSAKKLSIGKIVSVYNAMKHAWVSSLSSAQQFSLLKDVIWLKGAEVIRIGVPFDGEWKYGNDKKGNRGIIIKEEENRTMLHEALGL